MATTYRGRVQINGVLTRGGLNLRASQSVSSASLGLIPDGTELDVTLTSGKNWFRTTYGGNTGYVRAQDIAITTGGYPLYRVTVNTTLNIREKPSTSANAVFTAAKDRGLYVLETSGNWHLVSCNIGTGWASSSYLTPDSTAVPFDYPTIDEFIARLESFCDRDWSYALGYSSTAKTIDCANFPYVARFSLGEHNVPGEYNSIPDDVSEKGVIESYDQLERGMEVFQGTDHMGVYAGFVTFPNGQTLPAVYQSRATYNANQQAMYSERTGPNLTEMNNNWDHWAWSKYVQH